MIKGICGSLVKRGLQNVKVQRSKCAYLTKLRAGAMFRHYFKTITFGLVAANESMDFALAVADFWLEMADMALNKTDWGDI